MQKLIPCLIFILSSILPGLSQNWLTSFEDAKSIALNEKKSILLVFSGSDWCAPCIKLERDIWSSEEFKKYATESLVLLKADFPRRKKNELSDKLSKQNETLAEQFNPNGIFPLVVKLNNIGEVIGEMGYKNIPPQKYINALETL